MLTTVERVLFLVALLASGYGTYRGFSRIFQAVARGQEDGRKPHWGPALLAVLAQIPVFRARRWTSLFHAFIFFGFLIYGLVNLQDALAGYVAGFQIFGTTPLQALFAGITDLFSVLVLVGIVYFVLRRYVFQDPRLRFSDRVRLHPAVPRGIPKDSLIVAAFIFFHVGFRLFGRGAELALTGEPGTTEPFATALASMLSGLSPTTLTVLVHVSWWMALGLILAFFPYFPYSKHIHLFFAPVKWAYRLDAPMNRIPPMNLEDESVEQFGVARLEHLPRSQLLDPYACIMCNRCQEVCPAYTTGKSLSPSALIINMRYELNKTLSDFASGAESRPLLSFALDDEALWSCTTCGACMEICPVGNEQMQILLGLRQDRVLMESDFPTELNTMFTGIERMANPWNLHASERMKWAEGLGVPTVRDNPDFDVLLWVGCAAASDDRAKKIARSVVKVFQAAGVNFAVLGEEEKCTGDPARRAGNEYFFQMRAMENVEILNSHNVKRIVTLCPHCYNTLKNEYPDFGGHYEVYHHSQFLEDLLKSGKLRIKKPQEHKVVFHDPCYLGRHNNEYEAPRFILQNTVKELTEMPRSRNRSFCCGAGGAQMFKEEAGDQKINLVRTREALQTGADTIVTGCPFCMRMLTDGVNAEAPEGQVAVKDLAEVLAEALDA